MTVATEKNLIELTKEYIEKFNNKDLRGISLLLTEDFALEDPVINRVEGRDHALTAINAIFENNENLHFSAKNIFQDGTTTIIEFQLQLGETILKGTDIIDWHGEKIHELRAYLDIPK